MWDLPGWGIKPCLLSWQADSSLDYQGSLWATFLILLSYLELYFLEQITPLSCSTMDKEPFPLWLLGFYQYIHFSAWAFSSGVVMVMCLLSSCVKTKLGNIQKVLS